MVPGDAVRLLSAELLKDSTVAPKLVLGNSPTALYFLSAAFERFLRVAASPPTAFEGFLLVAAAPLTALANFLRVLPFSTKIESNI